MEKPDTCLEMEHVLKQKPCLEKQGVKINQQHYSRYHPITNPSS